MLPKLVLAVVSYRCVQKCQLDGRVYLLQNVQKFVCARVSSLIQEVTLMSQSLMIEDIQFRSNTIAALCNQKKGFAE